MNDQAPAAQPMAPEANYVPPASAPEPAPAPEPVRAGFQGQRQPFDPRDKSPRIAAAMSVAPGLGQIYIGYYVRGFVTAATFLVMVYMANQVPGDVAPMFGFSAAFVWLFNIIDAGRTAALYNHSIAGAGAIELPENFQMPATGGSLVGGAMLTAFGLLALSNTALGFSLLWLEDWWPLFPLALGLYLVAVSLKERAN